MYPPIEQVGGFFYLCVMLQVEGKTFHKFVELKSYRTQTFKDSCPFETTPTYPVEKDCLIKKTGRFYYDELYLTEDEFVKTLELGDKM